MKNFGLLFLTHLWSSLLSFSQCPTIAPEPSTCDTSTAIAIPISGLLAAGNIYKLSSKTSQSLTGALNGANSVINICNGQTLNLAGSINGSGVTINVLSGGTLNFSAVIAKLISSAIINVYGSMTVSNPQLNLNSGADIRIASSGTITTNILRSTASSSFTVEGTADIGTLNIASSSAVTCVNSAGCIKTGNATSLLNTILTTSVGILYFTNTTCPTTGTATGVVSNSPVRICYAGAGPCNNGSGSNVFGTSAVTYSCSPTGSTCSAAVTLPVDLVYFKTYAHPDGAICKWEIKSQKNSKYFFVEKSQDGIDWQKLGNVLVQRDGIIFGNYSITDNKPFTGINYYKLSEVDTEDNVTAYSVSYLEIIGNQKGFNVYPNPTNGELNVNVLEASEKSIFEILDFQGKLIYKCILMPGINTLGKVLTENGMYIVKFKTDKFQSFQKIIIKI